MSSLQMAGATVFSICNQGLSRRQIGVVINSCRCFYIGNIVSIAVLAWLTLNVSGWGCSVREG